MSCSFHPFMASPCGLNPRYSSQETFSTLTNCNKDISPHLRSLQLMKTSGVENEIDLILCRVGKFGLPSDWKSLTICPKHRDQLGIGWRRTSSKCSVPQKLSGHSDKRRQVPTGHRSIGKELSQKLYKETGVLLPVGTGDYSILFFQL